VNQSAQPEATADELGIHVRRGRIGIVGPAGAASQEVAARIHDFTGGVSRHVATTPADLGTGGDAAETLRGIRELDDHAGTDVVVVVGTAPSPAAARLVLDAAHASGTPVVVCLVGADAGTVADASTRGVDLHTRSKPAALAAVVASGVDPATLDLHALNWPLIEEVRALLSPAQREIRGYFTSGALCAEALFLALETHPEAATNLVGTPAAPVAATGALHGTVFLDLGEAGAAERARLLREAAEDPAVGVVVVDFVLGAEPDPVGALAPAIVEAKAVATAQGRHFEVLGYVLGTDADEPSLATQADALVATGATWASSATNTGLLAREFVVKG